MHTTSPLKRINLTVRRASVLLIILAVALLWAGGQGIRAAAGDRVANSATTSGGTGGTAVKAATPATTTPTKTATASAAMQKKGQGQGQGQGQAKGKMRSTTKAQREAARTRQAPQKKGVGVKYAGLNPATKTLSPLAAIGTGTVTMLATMAAPNSMPDYFAVANWANSPLPTVGPGPITGITITSGGGGYQNPVVTITDPTGTGAVATATATAGVITSIAVTNGGTGYSSPVVTITDNNGISAGASAFVSAFGTITGGIRKFVDTLPGLTAGNANNLGTYIPLAVADTTTFPGSDFYRIGLTEYKHQFHSDLPGPTNTAFPVGTNVRGYRDMGNPSDSVPHYLGPFILATKNRPVRVLFQNGIATDLNIPTDITYMGAGPVSDGSNSALASQKRATLHLHGGATPWISDGTPHQWITPSGGDGQPAAFGFQKGLSFQNVPDMVTGSAVPCASADLINVPCFTPTLDDGLATFYWTNQQSGKLLFYHDHAYGVTRLNVYDGEAAGYLIVDPVEETALGAATVPGTIVTDPNTGAIVSADLAHLVPLVIQDKTFVPDPATQLAAQDPTWDVAGYGGFGSLWFSHVYMPNQNPYDNSGANPYGRWDWGPWFFPPQDPSTFVPAGQPKPCTSAAYPGQTLICPGTPLPSGTPEAFMDTPVINGTAYPVLNVATAAYRFRMLMAGNDRTWNLGLYYAVDKNGVVCKGGNTFDTASCTEMAMVPAAPHSANTNPPLCTTATQFPPAGGLAAATLVNGLPINGTGLPAGCWPTTWPTDGRDGGVPDPATAGPPIIQFGTEGGLLPAPVVIPSTPNGYEYNRRSITVLNIFAHGLLLGPAERADAIVDFSGVPAGSVLILYNDAPAPVPAFDPRSDYYTGDPDQTDTGGAPSTQPGYGPNTRTIMQIQVSAPGGALPGNAVAFSLPTLAAAQPGLFVSTQDQIIVPETAYPVGNGNGATDTYVRISDTSINMGSGALSGITLTSGGSGYTSAPTILILPPANGGIQATAVAALTPTPVASLTLTSAGSGYTSAPAVAIAGGGGSGATATAALAPTGVASVTLTAGGSYTATPGVTLSGGGGSGATATAALTPTSLASLNLTAGGSGYTSVPTIGITGGGGTGATAVATLSVNAVTLTSGGSGYNSPPAVVFTGGGGSGAAASAVMTPTSVQNIAVTSGGSGYTSAPKVTISGGGGSGATATANVNRSGVVTSVKVNNGGANYTSLPAVTFSGGGGSGAAATATLKPTSVASVIVNNGGTLYTSVPAVSFSGGGGTGAAATAIMKVGALNLTSGGSGYTDASAVTVSFTGGGGSGAAATANLTPTPVASVTVTNAGSGYTSAPSVVFSSGTAAAFAALQPTSVASITLINPGAGYTSAPSVTFSGGGGSGATATAALPPTSVASVTLTNAGTGYNTTPLVYVTGGGGAGAAAVAGPPIGTTPLLPKTIQELFTLDYGRMNATLGVEVPFTNFLTQTTIPYGYVDPPTEIFKNNETQIWKITHNGVDTHFIHFHLFNVQVVNRVGWDGAIKPPDANELSWKDTVRMNPLEDIIVALKPYKQTLPWDLPNSVRPLDVTTPVGSAFANEFTNVDPNNQPATVTNDVTNFGWEYVWHCHILGHEENDMMRAMVFAVAPVDPSGLTAAGGNGGPVVLTWTDNSLNETGFTIQIASSATGPWTTLTTVPGVAGAGNAVTYTDSTSPAGTYYYQVIANNVVGYTKAYPAPALGYPSVSADATALVVGPITK